MLQLFHKRWKERLALKASLFKSCEEVKLGTFRERICLSFTHDVFFILLFLFFKSSHNKFGQLPWRERNKVWKQSFLFGREGKGCSASVYERTVSHHSYLLWIHSLDSESARLFRLEGLTHPCCHEQKLLIMNSQLQVTHAFKIQLTTNHVVKEMAFLNDVRGDHRKNCTLHVAVQHNWGWRG